MSTRSVDLVRKLMTTPVGDVLRGELSARLDERKPIEGLPAPVAALVAETVRKTRLRRREKVDIAAELADHFDGGLAVGEQPAVLVARFGDPKTAATLIRRAAIRRRSLARRACGWVAAAAAITSFTLILLTGLIWLRGAMLHPMPASEMWNYVSEYNNALLSGPADELAWPLYRQAFIELNLRPAVRATD